jgi:hypothetical protein
MDEVGLHGTILHAHAIRVLFAARKS